MSGDDGEPDEAVFTQLQEHGDFFFDTVGVSGVILWLFAGKVRKVCRYNSKKVETTERRTRVRRWIKLKRSRIVGNLSNMLGYSAFFLFFWPGFLRSWWYFWRGHLLSFLPLLLHLLHPADKVGVHLLWPGHSGPVPAQGHTDDTWFILMFRLLLLRTANAVNARHPYQVKDACF